MSDMKELLLSGGSFKAVGFTWDFSDVISNTVQHDDFNDLMLRLANATSSGSFVVMKELKDLFISGLWSNNPIDNGIADNVALNDWLICIGGKYSYENKEPKFEPYITDTSKLNTVGQLRALTRESTGNFKAPASPPL